VRCASSVRPSVPSVQLAGSPSNSQTRLACTHDVMKVKNKIKGHVMRSCTFVILQENNIASFPGKWLDRDQTHSFADLPFPFSITPQSQMAAILRCEFCHSSHREAVCQTVCYIVYGLTFCPSVHTLYEAPLHSLSRLSIRQLNLMSKCHRMSYSLIDGLQFTLLARRSLSAASESVYVTEYSPGLSVGLCAKVSCCETADWIQMPTDGW